MLGRIADLTWKRPRSVLAAVLAVAAVAGVFGHDVEHHLKAAGFTDAESESERATSLVRDALGFDAAPGIVVLVRHRDPGRPLDLDDAGTRREIERLATRLERIRHVGRVENPLADTRSRAAFVERGSKSLVLTGHLSTQDIEDEGGIAAEEAVRRLRSDKLRVTFGGFATSFNEVNDQTRRDLTNAELIAFPALAVLLLLVFRGVVAAAIPLLIGVLSILGTFLVLRLMAAAVDTSLFALNIATALSLGLAVDYALLMVSRYREELERDGPTRAAHRRTVLTAGRAAMFSGATIAVCMASLLVLPQRFLYSLGAAGAAVGLLSSIVAVLVVPSILALAGERINALSIRRGPLLGDDSGGWYRLARGVMRRPVLVAVTTAAVMLALAGPLLGTLLTGPSAEAVPDTQPSYKTNAYVADHYPRDVTEAVVVAVDGRASGDALGRLRERIDALDHVAGVTPFSRASEDVAVARVALDRPALSVASQDAVRAIRRLDAGPTARVLATGNTARFIDQKQSIVDHAPLVLLLVSATTFVLLFGLTGSILLPLKTLLMNGLTLAATLGLMVLVFQHGVLDELLGYDGPPAIEVTSLVFLLAVTFGLATDYAVLVMARIKEQHDRGLPNDEAVALGIGRTGRVISAAAVMIAVVFMAFAVSPVFFMKQIAVGMAAGVVIDATIVRALLVPALMRLLGAANWWAPRPLARLQRRFGFQE